LQAIWGGLGGGGWLPPPVEEEDDTEDELEELETEEELVSCEPPVPWGLASPPPAPPVPVITA
jgi:hypothetical protein